MTMEVVLDTSALQHLLRRPKVKPKPKKPEYSTTVDDFLKRRKLQLTLDQGKALLTEWEQTCGREIVGVVVSVWDSWKAIRYVKELPKLAPASARRLHDLEFCDAIDKVVIRISLATEDKCAVSEDSDFWNPKDKKSKGDARAPVACHCRDHHGITILLLGELLTKLRQHK